MNQDAEALHLVPLSESHLEATLRWMNDSEIMNLLDREHIISRAEHADWFTKLASDSTRAYFAIEVANRHVGNIWLVDIDPRNNKAELRIALGAALDRGYGSMAIELLTRHAFSALQLHRLYAYVLAFNIRAVRAFEKAGFKKEGLLLGDRKRGGSYINSWLLARVNAST